MRRPGRKPTSDTYSVAQVAAMLLATSQIWLKVTAGDLSSTRAEASCSVCFGKREIRRQTRQGVLISTCPRCNGSTASSEEIADGLAEYVRGSFGDPESIMVALADLSIAWAKIPDGARRAIGRFLEEGPLHFGNEDVEFQSSAHRSAVLKLWRSINRFGEFERRKDGDEGPTGRRLHAVSARGGDVQRLSAGDPLKHGRPGRPTGDLGREPSSLVA